MQKQLAAVGFTGEERHLHSVPLMLTSGFFLRAIPNLCAGKKNPAKYSFPLQKKEKEKEKKKTQPRKFSF